MHVRSAISRVLLTTHIDVGRGEDEVEGVWCGGPITGRTENRGIDAALGKLKAPVQER